MSTLKITDARARELAALVRDATPGHGRAPLRVEHSEALREDVALTAFGRLLADRRTLLAALRRAAETLSDCHNGAHRDDLVVLADLRALLASAEGARP